MQHRDWQGAAARKGTTLVVQKHMTQHDAIAIGRKSCARHFEPPADINPAKPGDFNAGWHGPFLAGVA
ncbi:MAG: hypothetical protein V5B38_13630 [Candidatus Accumulibacter propinquus]